MLMGETNAKVGANRNGREREREMGPNGSGEINEIGERLADFCSINNLVI